MKHTPLTGYVIHQRAYQEKRALYTFFSREHGLVAGVSAKGLPLFVPMTLFATGKNSLKTFSQVNFIQVQTDDSVGQVIWRPSSTDGQYAALYLNELLYKLLAIEDAHPMLWQVYDETLTALKNVTDGLIMRLLLRRFELMLFAELGVVIEFGVDSTDTAICERGYYRYVANVGFMPSGSSSGTLLGGDIVAMAVLSELLCAGQLHQAAAQVSVLNLLGGLHRIKIDALLDFKPLHSRQLWQDQARLKTS